VERNSEDICRGVKYLLDNPDVCVRIAQIPVNGLSNNQQIMQEIEKCFER